MLSMELRLSTNAQTVQQQNACVQQQKVKAAIREALTAMRREFASTYQPESGRYAMPSHWRRVSEAQVLRRAGGVDKNTLKQPYHSDIRGELRQFVEHVRDALDEGRPGKGAPQSQHGRLTGAVARLSQLLAGAEHRLIANQQDVEDWRRRCDWLEARLEERDTTIARMEGHLNALLRQHNGGAEVVSLRSGSAGQADSLD
jgi:hypothetical protein